MIGGAAPGTFSCAVWLPLSGLIVNPGTSRPFVIHTFPMTIANAVNTARVTSPVHRARLTKPHALSIE